MNFDYMLLGKKFKEARESLEIDILEASSYINRTPEEYTDIERGVGQVDGDLIILLAKLFRRDFRYFVTGGVCTIMRK